MYRRVAKPLLNRGPRRGGSRFSQYGLWWWMALGPSFQCWPRCSKTARHTHDQAAPWVRLVRRRTRVSWCPAPRRTLARRRIRSLPKGLNSGAGSISLTPRGSLSSFTTAQPSVNSVAMIRTQRATWPNLLFYVAAAAIPSGFSSTFSTRRSSSPRTPPGCCRASHPHKTFRMTVRGVESGHSPNQPKFDP